MDAEIALEAIAVLATCLFAVKGVPGSGTGKVLWPSALGSLILLSIFGIRPLVASPTDYDLYGLNAYAGAHYAEAIGALATASFAVGLRVRTRVRLTRRSPSDLQDAAVVRPAFYVAIISVLGCLLWALSLALVAGPGILNLVFRGRSKALGVALAGYPNALLTFSLAGSAAATVWLCITLPTRRVTRIEVCWVTVGVALSALFSSFEGSRRYLIPAVLAPCAATVIARNCRLPRLLGPLLVLGLLVVMVLPSVRSVGSRLPNQSLGGALVTTGEHDGIGGILDNYFTSNDTEMFNYIAYVGPKLGGALPFGDGAGTFGDLVKFPLPTALSGQLYTDQLLSKLFGQGCQGSACPVASAPGVLLFDFGPIGVLVGMVLAGVAVRTVELRAAFESHRNSTLFASLLAGYAPILMRTDVTIAVWWTIYFILLTMAIKWSLTIRILPISQSARLGGQPRSNA